MTEIIITEEEWNRLKEISDSQSPNFFHSKVENLADCELVYRVSNPNFFISNVLDILDKSSDTVLRYWRQFLFQKFGLTGDNLNKELFKIVGFLEQAQTDFPNWPNFNYRLKYVRMLPQSVLDKLGVIIDNPTLKIKYTIGGNTYSAKVVSLPGDNLIICQKNVLTGFKRRIFVATIYKNFLAIPNDVGVEWHSILNEFGNDFFMQFTPETNILMEDTREKGNDNFFCQHPMFTWEFKSSESITNFSHVIMPKGQTNRNNNYVRDVVATVPFITPLKVKRPDEVEEVVDRNSCAICLSNYNADSSRAVLTTCGHLFHEECIKRHSDTDNRCPLCRNIFDPENQILRVF